MVICFCFLLKLLRRYKGGLTGWSGVNCSTPMSPMILVFILLWPVRGAVRPVYCNPVFRYPARNLRALQVGVVSVCWMGIHGGTHDLATLTPNKIRYGRSWLWNSSIMGREIPNLQVGTPTEVCCWWGLTDFRVLTWYPMLWFTFLLFLLFFMFCSK